MPQNICVQKLSDLPDLSQARAIVLDTETSGVYPHHGDRICGIGIGPFDADINYYIPIRHQNHSGPLANLPEENVLHWLRDLGALPDKKWGMHNAKFDLTMLRYDGIEIAGPVIDTMLMAHGLDGNRFNYELDSLALTYIPNFDKTYVSKLADYIKQTQPTLTLPDESKSMANYSLIPIWEMAPYACGDIQTTRDLAKVLDGIPKKGRVTNQGNPAWTQRELMAHDMKVMRVLFEMEWNGVRVNVERCQRLKDQAEGEMNYYADKLKRLSGFSFSPLTWSVLDKAFSEAGGKVKYWSLPKDKKGKQKLDQFTAVKEESTGRPCWNAMAVYKYVEEFKATKNERAMEWVLAYREFTQRQRLVATNLDSYLSGIDERRRLHGQFHLHRVLTGRLSSSNPNLQNICKPKGTLDQKLLEKLTGEKNDEALNRQMRSLFTVERGNAWVSMDFSQIEYRAAAYFAQDQTIIQRYRNDPNTDYHAATAEICGITDRDHAKTANFGTLYQMGAKSLGSLLMVPENEARAILHRIYQARPALKLFVNKMLAWAEKNCYVQNPFGRVCGVQSNYAYKAVNYLVQGFVGDMMREALVNVYDYIQVNKWPVKMLLTVHDELDFEMPTESVREYAPELARVMCSSQMMPTVPILCDIEVGKDWGKTLVSLDDWLKGSAA